MARQRHLCREALSVGELLYTQVTGKARELQENPESCNEGLESGRTLRKQLLGAKN